MTARNIRHPHTRLKALRNNTGLHVIRPAPVAPCMTDDVYLPVETIRNIRHRRLLLMNQNETLSSAVTAKEGYPMGCRRRLRSIKVVIPLKANRKVQRACDFALYAERNLVERFFNYIKQFRGIATRYEKTARNFLAGLHLVCALAWLK